MAKRLHRSDGAPHSGSRHPALSMGSSGLTAASHTELLKHIGYHLQTGYQNVLKEPAPERIRELLQKLEACGRRPDDDPADEDM